MISEGSIDISSDHAAELQTLIGEGGTTMTPEQALRAASPQSERP